MSKNTEKTQSDYKINERLYLDEMDKGKKL